MSSCVCVRDSGTTAALLRFSSHRKTAQALAGSPRWFRSSPGRMGASLSVSCPPPGPAAAHRHTLILWSHLPEPTFLWKAWELWEGQG